MSTCGAVMSVPKSDTDLHAPTRKLGNDDVPALGFGLMGLSAEYGKVGDDEERFKVGDFCFVQYNS